MTTVLRDNSFSMSLREEKERPLEDELHHQLREAGIVNYTRQEKFIPSRRFKADFWFGALRLAVEVDGGIYMKRRSGHTTGTGYHSDRVRDQLALSEGIVTLRFTSPQVRSGEAVTYLLEYLPVREREVAAWDFVPFRKSLPIDYGSEKKKKAARKRK